MIIDQQKVKELFDCDDGYLYWKTNPSNVKIGAEAGCIDPRGYCRVRIKGKYYYAHRLIWLWHHGYFPENDIDHIDKNKLNNRIENLREVSTQCNIRNSGNRSDNTSGVKGVYWYKRTKKWISSIMVNQVTKHLGYYNSFDDAVLARLAAEQHFGWKNCDSSSPAYVYAKTYKLI